MLEKFKSLATSLIGMQPLWLGMSEDNPLYNYYVVEIVTVSDAKSVLFGLSDKAERSTINYQTNVDSSSTDKIYSVSLVEEDLEKRVYLHKGKYIYNAVSRVYDRIFLQFHWSLESGCLETVYLSDNLLLQMQYDFIDGKEKTNHGNLLLADIPQTLTGQTEILGIPIEWHKDNVKELAEKVIQTVSDRAETLISKAPKSSET